MRTSLFPYGTATQTARGDAITLMCSAQQARFGPTRMVATTRFVAGSIRETLGPPAFATQTAPGETAIPSGLGPTSMVAVTLFVRGVDASDRVVGRIGEPNAAVAGGNRFRGIDHLDSRDDCVPRRVDPHERRLGVAHGPDSALTDGQRSACPHRRHSAPDANPSDHLAAFRQRGREDRAPLATHLLAGAMTLRARRSPRSRRPRTPRRRPDGFGDTPMCVQAPDRSSRRSSSTARPGDSTESAGFQGKPWGSFRTSVRRSRLWAHAC